MFLLVEFHAIGADVGLDCIYRLELEGTVVFAVWIGAQNNGRGDNIGSDGLGKSPNDNRLLAPRAEMRLGEAVFTATNHLEFSCKFLIISSKETDSPCEETGGLCISSPRIGASCSAFPW